MVELDESNFAEKTSEGVVVVDFYAPWCAPCRALSPILEKIENANVYKVNVDDSPELSTKFNVYSIPLVVFMKDGVEVERVVGLQSQEAIQNKVDLLNE